MNLTRFKQLVFRLRRGKEYREAFVESEISIGIPFQIRAIREKRKWSQQDLAEKTGKKQSVISQLENPNYGRLSLSTLKTLAAAFDCGLLVRFVPYSELIWRATNLSPDDLSIPDFDHDPGLTSPDYGSSTANIGGVWTQEIAIDHILVVDDIEVTEEDELGVAER